MSTLIKDAIVEVTDCLCRNCERSDEVKEALVNLIHLVFATNHDSDFRRDVESFLDGMYKGSLPQEKMNGYTVLIDRRAKSQALIVESKLKELGCTEIQRLDSLSMINFKATVNMIEELRGANRTLIIVKNEEVYAI